MNYIDLHVHSSISDCSFTPKEVVDLARNAKLRYIALTDHDTVDGIEAAITYAGKFDDIDIIPGTELSCYYLNREIHIVGLFLDYKDEALLSSLHRLENARLQRNLKMIQNFIAAGIPLTLDELQHGNPKSVITRAHFARILVEKGICKDKNEAFDKYLGIGCPFYLPKPQVTPEQILRIIKTAGGIAILAHPYSYGFSKTQVETLLDTLIPLGLSGIECYYSTYDDGQTQELRSIAHKKNLLVSGGSDFHGAIKPDISIGTGRGKLRIPEKLLQNMLQCHS